MHSCVLGATPTGQLAITVLAFPRPAFGDAYQWLPCEVRISAGGFTGQFKASFLPSELHTLLQDLERVYRDLKAQLVSNNPRLPAPASPGSGGAYIAL